mmetsp:Transcript_27381/g.51368  ORF Transcript_27381/g.51368 Transcript_27381/m.51368 type:complete len:119 (+) Transcript_27381:1348-1704(+)
MLLQQDGLWRELRNLTITASVLCTYALYHLACQPAFQSYLVLLPSLFTVSVQLPSHQHVTITFDTMYCPNRMSDVANVLDSILQWSGPFAAVSSWSGNRASSASTTTATTGRRTAITF